MNHANATCTEPQCIDREKQWWTSKIRILYWIYDIISIIYHTNIYVVYWI